MCSIFLIQLLEYWTESIFMYRNSREQPPSPFWPGPGRCSISPRRPRSPARSSGGGWREAAGPGPGPRPWCSFRSRHTPTAKEEAPKHGRRVKAEAQTSKKTPFQAFTWHLQVRTNSVVMVSALLSWLLHSTASALLSFASILNFKSSFGDAIKTQKVQKRRVKQREERLKKTGTCPSLQGGQRSACEGAGLLRGCNKELMKSIQFNQIQLLIVSNLFRNQFSVSTH